MQKLEILKQATSLTVGLGVSTIVGNVVTAVMPAQAKIYTKIISRIGGAAVIVVIADLAAKSASEFVDTTAAEVSNLKTAFAEAKNKVQE